MHKSRCFVVMNVLLFAIMLWFLIINDTANAHAASSEPAGRVVYVAVDPQNSEIVYVVATRGLYKSVDGGGSWNRITSESTGGFVNPLVIDPNNTAVMYTLKHIKTDNNNDVGGIIKSTDSGRTWRLSMEIENHSSYKIIVDPNNSSIVYTIGDGRIYKSADTGLNWERLTVDVESHYVPITLAVSHQKPSTVYVGISANGTSVDRILKSVDNGKIWVDMGKIETKNKMNDRDIFHTIAVSPHDLNTVYALSHDRLYKSTDGCNSWEALNSPFKNEGRTHNDIALTNNPNIIYVTTGVGFYRSVDGGKNWELATESYWNYMVSDFFAIYTKNHEIIYTGGLGLLYKSIDSGRTWTNITKGLPGGLSGGLEVELLPARIYNSRPVIPEIIRLPKPEFAPLF